MKLISNASFGEFCKSKEKEFPTTNVYLAWYEEIRTNFDKFIKQPLKLEMFVPCDNYGNVLFNPFADDNDAGTDKEYKQTQYNKAKEKVLFEGFKIRSIELNKLEFCENLFWIKENSSMYEDEFGNEGYIYTIEDLVKFDLNLTESAIKQIGL